MRSSCRLLLFPFRRFPAVLLLAEAVDEADVVAEAVLERGAEAGSVVFRGDAQGEGGSYVVIDKDASGAGKGGSIGP